MLGVILSPTTQQTLKTRGARRTALQAVTVSENSSITIRTWRFYYRGMRLKQKVKKTSKAKECGCCEGAQIGSI